MQMNSSPFANMDQKKLDSLLQAVSQKLGMPPEQLRKELSEGKFDAALKRMNSADAAKFSQALQNPGMVEKLMSTPQAQALYKKLTGGK